MDSGAQYPRQFQLALRTTRLVVFEYSKKAKDDVVKKIGAMARLKVIYSNGTESNLLFRSLTRAFYKGDDGRRITNPNSESLFSDISEDDDIESGTIYVLRSKSEHPVVAANRNLLHKIGVTGGNVSQRIANAALEPTYLMAGVEIVATYKLFNINRTKLENIFHRVFGPAQMDIEIKDRFAVTRLLGI